MLSWAHSLATASLWDFYFRAIAGVSIPYARQGFNKRVMSESISSVHMLPFLGLGLMGLAAIIVYSLFKNRR